MLRNLHAHFNSFVTFYQINPVKIFNAQKKKSYFYSVLPLKHNFIFGYAGSSLLCGLFCLGASRDSYSCSAQASAVENRL